MVYVDPADCLPEQQLGLVRRQLGLELELELAWQGTVVAAAVNSEAYAASVASVAGNASY